MCPCTIAYSANSSRAIISWKLGASTNRYSTPWVSPARGGRVVVDTLNESAGNSARSRLHSVVLPAPEGDETTNRSPRGRVPMGPRSLDIRHLLADLFECALGVDDDARGHVTADLTPD